MLPIAAVLWLAFAPSGDIWSHLVSTVLPRYLANTAILMAGVAAGTLVIGTGTAWLVATCRFPGRSVLGWALVLPLAAPAYVVAFVYTDLLEYAGPVQRGLRAVTGWRTPQDYWFPEIRSKGGAIAVLTLVLYPYVYVLARTAFLQQSVGLLEAARTLGRGPWQSFRTVALPLARPALAVGTTLALMETLADFGAIHFFGVHTLTAGLFDVWLGMGSAAGAAQIALVMLVLVLALLWVERRARSARRFQSTTHRRSPRALHTLRGVRAAGAAVACGLPIALGFGVPAALLATYSVGRIGSGDWDGIFVYAGNSLMLAGLAAVVVVALGAVLCLARRFAGGPVVAVLTRVAVAGYAIPGIVVALGVMIPLAAFDNAVDRWMKAMFGLPTGLLLSGTVFAVVLAYVVRFLAMGVGAAEAGLARITPSMEDAARTLGHTPRQAMLRVHLPLLRPSLAAGGLIALVEGLKELPATLLLRPFDFDTLATYVFQFASDERLEACAPGALMIVAAGILPVLILDRTMAGGPGRAPGVAPGPP